MNYSDFLPTSDDVELRKILWSLYCYAEKEAMAFCNPGNPWINIRFVREAKLGELDGFWVWHEIPAQWAEMGLRPKNEDKGIAFHEVFHSTFHESPLYYDPKNLLWGDAFCDAFRYFMEEIQLCGKSEWLRDFKAYFGNFERQKGDNYRGWGSLIVSHCNRDYEEFKKFWTIRNTQSNIPISTLFGF